MSDDPYLYENTTVLKNNSNTKDQDYLDRFEQRETTIALKNLRDDPVKGRFDLQHLQEIHKRIFKDVYPFAGQRRTVNISKAEEKLAGASVDYATIINIRPQAQESLERLNQRDWSGLKDMSKPEDMKDFAKNVIDIWKAHPFREGNTRTTMTFVGQFAKERGFALDNELLSQNATFVRSSLVVGSYDKTEHLTRILTDARQRELVKETNTKQPTKEGTKDRSRER